MSLQPSRSGIDIRKGILIDTNLLVLLIVGLVNINRVENFKRTRQYSRGDHELLIRVVSGFSPVYTVAHVAAEVSNLTDLSGEERLAARTLMKRLLTDLNEPHIPSLRAASGHLFPRLGITDAAIIEVARDNGCAVVTDDLDLYLALQTEHLPVINFTHVREASWSG